MQMTESQKAFEAHTRFYHQLPDDYEFPKESDGTYAYSYQFRDFEKWQAAEAYGRKQALEDALAIVQNENKVGDMEFEIKELLNAK
jgi:hypothetical protein